MKPLTWPSVLFPLPPLDQPSTLYLIPPWAPPAPQDTECPRASHTHQHLLFVPARLSLSTGPHTDLPFMSPASHVFPGTAHYQHAHIKVDFWHARAGNNTWVSFSSPPGHKGRASRASPAPAAATGASRENHECSVTGTNPPCLLGWPLQPHKAAAGSRAAPHTAPSTAPLQIPPGQQPSQTHTDICISKLFPASLFLHTRGSSGESLSDG